jgi:hypothetical protein
VVLVQQDDSLCRHVPSSMGLTSQAIFKHRKH